MSRLNSLNRKTLKIRITILTLDGPEEVIALTILSRHGQLIKINYVNLHHHMESLSLSMETL